MINKTQQAHRYAISLVDAGPFVLQGARELQLAPGEILDVAVSVALRDGPAADSTLPLRFAVQELERPEVRVVTASTFVAPRQR